MNRKQRMQNRATARKLAVKVFPIVVKPITFADVWAALGNCVQAPKMEGV